MPKAFSLVVLGFLAVPTLFAQSAAAPNAAAAPVAPGPSTAPPAAATPADPPTRTLGLVSDRDSGWCGLASGEAKPRCVGPGDTLIASVEGAAMVDPHLCVDRHVVKVVEVEAENQKQLLARDLGNNRFCFRVAADGLRDLPCGRIRIHKAYLSTKKDNKNLPLCEGIGTASTTTSVDVVIAEPHLGRVGAGLIFAALAIGVLLLVRLFPALLRDPKKDQPDAALRPWSLGRVQLAWWTVIVFGGWGVILLVTGNYESLTPQALILLGVSVATTATGAAVQRR